MLDVTVVQVVSDGGGLVEMPRRAIMNTEREITLAALRAEFPGFDIWIEPAGSNYRFAARASAREPACTPSSQPTPPSCAPPSPPPRPASTPHTAPPRHPHCPASGGQHEHPPAPARSRPRNANCSSGPWPTRLQNC